MSKRKFGNDSDPNPCKKHTLDSDEEDSDDYEKSNLNESDIEGEEDGEVQVQNEIKITPFNMREELEEGHFDKDGHYHWSKENEVKDNWLDNIDWVKIKSNEPRANSENSKDSNNSSYEINERSLYTQILAFMEPNETIQISIQRLGKNKTKLTSIERIRQKKLGIVDGNAEKITKLTELTNELLTRTGNMDIYQATYDEIKTNTNCKKELVSDMYSEDFEKSEKNRTATYIGDGKKLQWEFKWKQDDDDLHGPFSTQQMHKWSQENYFKDGVYVRKVGESTNFYSSNRLDFELYL